MYKIILAIFLCVAFSSCCKETQNQPVIIIDEYESEPISTYTPIFTPTPFVPSPFEELELVTIPPSPFAPISEYGRQVAEDFLREYITIFVPPVDVYYEFNYDTSRLEETTNSYAWENEIVPDIYYGLSGKDDEWGLQEWVYFDKNDNHIDQAVWMYGDDYAYDFDLISVDDDGIPAIFIYFTQRIGSGDGGIRTVFYRFIDGKYQQIKHNAWNNHSDEVSHYSNQMVFLYDTKRNIILCSWSYYEYAAFFSINFERTMANTTIIATRNFTRDKETGKLLNSLNFEWENHLTGESGIPCVDFLDWSVTEPVFIPGMDTPLMLIPLLEELKSELNFLRNSE